MAASIQRHNDMQTDVVFSTTLADCTPIPFFGWAAGQVYLPAGTHTTLTWYGAPSENGAYVPVQDGAGNAVTSKVGASMAVLIPAACFGCRLLKAVADVAVTATVTLKA
jgi:hypothetical protein